MNLGKITNHVHKLLYNQKAKKTKEKLLVKIYNNNEMRMHVGRVYDTELDEEFVPIVNWFKGGLGGLLVFFRT